MSAHPFEPLFIKALRKSTPEENYVLEEAEALVQKGYRVDEVHGVLARLRATLLDDTEIDILDEALEEMQ